MTASTLRREILATASVAMFLPGLAVAEVRVVTTNPTLADLTRQSGESRCGSRA